MITYTCRRCNQSTRQMGFETGHCADALRSGIACWCMEVRSHVVEESGCLHCQGQKPASAPSCSQRSFPYIQDYNHPPAEPPYQGALHSCPSNLLAQHTIFEAPHHQQYQSQGMFTSISQPDEYVLDQPVGYSLPGLSQYEQPAHWHGSSDRTHHTSLYRHARRHENMPISRSDRQLQTAAEHVRHSKLPNSTYSLHQEQLTAAEEADIQRALAQSRHERELQEVKVAYQGQDRRISALERQMELDRERAQQDREEERYRAEWEQYSAEKVAWEASQKEATSAEDHAQDRRGLPSSHKLQFIVGKGGKEKEVWVGDVRKVNRKLVEYRRKLKPWEYELLQRH